MSEKTAKVLRFLTAEAFANPPALKFEDVSLPEFGEGAGMRIHELTAEGAQVFGARVGKEEDKNAMPLWVMASAVRVDENGETIRDANGNPVPIFEDKPETIKAILAMGASIVLRLGNTALRLNGFTKEEAEKEVKN